jgi:hypothetical protein
MHKIETLLCCCSISAQNIVAKQHQIVQVLQELKGFLKKVKAKEFY